MREPTRLRGSLRVRLAELVFGLFLFAAGIVSLLESQLGLSPWDVLHQGISEHTRLTFGEANIVVALIALVVARLLGARIGIATVANAILVGAFVQLLSSRSAVAALADSALPVRICLLALGLALMGAGSGFYLGADLGAGPRDSLMVVGARRTPFRIGIVRAALELSALAAGAALGGTVGVGTIVVAVGLGPAVELSLGLLARSPLALDRHVRLPPPARPKVSDTAPASDSSQTRV